MKMESMRKKENVSTAEEPNECVSTSIARNWEWNESAIVCMYTLLDDVEGMGEKRKYRGISRPRKTGTVVYSGREINNLVSHSFLVGNLVNLVRNANDA